MTANSQRSRKAGNGVGDVWAPIPRRGHRGRWLASSAPHRRRLPQTRAVLDQKHLGERRARPGLSRGAPLRLGGTPTRPRQAAPSTGFPCVRGQHCQLPDRGLRRSPPSSVRPGRGPGAALPAGPLWSPSIWKDSAAFISYDIDIC